MVKAKRADVKSTQAGHALEEQADREEKPAGKQRQPHSWIMIACAAGAVLLFFIIYLSRLDRVAGQVVDDAWYVLLAKALATGQGYTLINSPSSGILPFYPPAFPWLLSLVFRLAPQFPQNIWLLKSVSIAAMLGVGLASYYYFTRLRKLPVYVAFGIAMAVALSPAFVFLATSTVMSECVFTLAQLLTIITIERGVEVKKSGRSWRYALVSSALASFALLTRSMGIGLIAAVFVYLLKERLFRAAIVFGVGVMVCVGPWMVYTRAHAPTLEQRAEQSGNIVYSYIESFWHRRAGDAASGKVTVDDLPERVWSNTLQILGNDVGTIMAGPLFREATNSGYETLERRGRERSILSLILSALALIGFVAVAREKVTLAEIVIAFSLAIIVLWPWESFRFVLPFMAFVMFYILMGVQALHRFHQRWQQRTNLRAQWLALGIVAGCMVALSLYDHVSYLRQKSQPLTAGQSTWIQLFEENETLLKWLDQKLPKEGVIATPNPALVYLYTGHKTISFDNPVEKWETYNRLGMRYLAWTSLKPLPNPSFSEGRYNIIYRSRGPLNLRVVDFGPPASRAPWGSVDPARTMKIDADR